MWLASSVSRGRIAVIRGLLLYQSRWNGKAVSELKIKAKAVVKADAPHARYDVELTLSNWSQSPAFSLFGR